jgi:hypothetical protein
LKAGGAQDTREEGQKCQRVNNQSFKCAMKAGGADPVACIWSCFLGGPTLLGGRSERVNLNASKASTSTTLPLDLSSTRQSPLLVMSPGQPNGHTWKSYGPMRPFPLLTPGPLPLNGRSSLPPCPALPVGNEQRHFDLRRKGPSFGRTDALEGDERVCVWEAREAKANRSRARVVQSPSGNG